MGFETSNSNSTKHTTEFRQSDTNLARLGIHAEVVDSTQGLSIQFTVSGKLEKRIRLMFNEINDHNDHQNDADLSVAMMHMFNIAADAVQLISKNQSRIY